MRLHRQVVSQLSIFVRRADINGAAIRTYSLVGPTAMATLLEDAQPMTSIAVSNPLSVALLIKEMIMSAITIYTTPTCPYCVAAKALLKNKGLSYREINLQGDRAAAVALMERTGRRSVPQIFIGETHVGGFDDLNALETAGRLDPLLEANALR
jgi:glutaredoxin 3